MECGESTAETSHECKMLLKGEFVMGDAYLSGRCFITLVVMYYPKVPTTYSTWPSNIVSVPFQYSKFKLLSIHLVVPASLEIMREYS